jgi:hypothetical protein
LRVDDCRKTHAELVAKGVEFVQEPAELPYGIEAIMRDVSGNWLVLVETGITRRRTSANRHAAAL